MARDEMARERDPEQSLLDCPSHLRLAGAAAATVAGTTVAGDSSERDHVPGAGAESAPVREVPNGDE